MPWKEQRAMSLKLQFVERAVLKGSNLTELCREFGVSRQTGHKWLRRYRELGPLGLVEHDQRRILVSRWSATSSPPQKLKARPRKNAQTEPGLCHGCGGRI
jgi:transposase-like protein